VLILGGATTGLQVEEAAVTPSSDPSTSPGFGLLALENSQPYTIGKQVEFVTAAVMMANAGSGPALRYPYAGHVATVLGLSENHIQIQFGSKLGWVPKDSVEYTERDQDPIRLAWQFLGPNKSSYVKKSPDQSHYNVYAPVMYAVGSNSISIINNQNFSNNITIAKKNGYKVWLTIQQFGTSPNFKDNIIEQIINVALLHDVDGINIDFEGMGEQNQAGFTEFMTKLYPRAKEYGFVVSIDVTRHAANNYGLSYDRAALGQVSDYIALMAYDEHWRTSPLAGSVASMRWTNNSIRLLLQEVPPEKILLGIPFYTRNWLYENSAVATQDIVVMKQNMLLRAAPWASSGAAVHLGKEGETYPYLGTVMGQSIWGERTWYMVDLDGQAAYVSGYYARYVPAGEVYGTSGLSSYAISMQSTLDIYANYDLEARTSSFFTRARTLVQIRNVVISYDEATGQNLVTYIDNQDRLNKIWVEDFNSLNQRSHLMEHYNLAGLAAWSLEWVDGEQQVWTMIKKRLPR
jgi:spore germination protein YaaH